MMSYMGLCGVLIFLIILCLYPFGDKYVFGFLKLACWFFERTLLNSDIYYYSKIKKNTNYVFMPNHQSYLDCLIAYLVPGNIQGIAAGIVEKMPVIGRILKVMGVLFVNIDGKKNSIVDRTVEKLKADHSRSLMIFPEGGRFFDGIFHTEKVRSGGFHIAKQTGYPIIPIYLTFGNVVNDPKKEYNFWGKTCILVGETITTENKEVDIIIEEYVREMKRLENLSNAYYTRE